MSRARTGVITSSIVLPVSAMRIVTPMKGKIAARYGRILAFPSSSAASGKLVAGQFLIHTKCAHETPVTSIKDTIGGSYDRWNRLFAGVCGVPRKLDAPSREL